MKSIISLFFSLVFCFFLASASEINTKGKSVAFDIDNTIIQKTTIMKIKFGAIVTEGRGKLGGHVFSKNTSGSYIRTKTTPTNPQTTFQTSVRALFGAISQGWSTITEAQRTSFNTAVADWSTTDIFGDLKNPTGKALYQRLNNQAQSSGHAAVISAPAKVELPDDVVTAATFGIGTSTLTLTGVSASADVNVVISGSPKLTQGTKFVKNKLRQLYAVAGDAVDPADQYDAYVDRFGTPALGENIYIAVKYVADNGQASPLQMIKATITA